MARKLKLRRGAIVETRDGSVYVVKNKTQVKWVNDSLWECSPIVALSPYVKLLWSTEVKVKGYADDI